MSHRNNFFREQLEEHLTERQWTEEDKANFLHMVGSSALMSAQGVLSVLEYQQATDERIKAEKQFDEAFVPGIPQDFFETGYDSEGRYINPEAGA